ncbi:MAG: SH3 domain-containing protein, partial [Chloroflexi bacterium]|nr:SH3 domain-containing protein [Chloroflexota bacterium]
ISVTAYRADGTASDPATATITLIAQAGAATETPTDTPTETPAATPTDLPSDTPTDPPTAPPTATTREPARPPSATCTPTLAATAQAEPSLTVSLIAITAPATGAPPTASAAAPLTATTIPVTAVPPTAPPTITPPAPPTATPTITPTETANAPAVIATFRQSINVRRGPGTIFQPPLGIFSAGQTAEVLAVTANGQWYKVRYLDGAGWVFNAQLTLAGDPSTLPVDSGPPTPTPFVPATPAGPPAVNLVAGMVSLNPETPRCNEVFGVTLAVTNAGTQAPAVSGTVALRDVRAADDAVQATTVGIFPVLPPGATFEVTMPLTISTWYSEGHRLELVIDPNDVIDEVDETDNRAEISYVLDRAGCP